MMHEMTCQPVDVAYTLVRLFCHEDIDVCVTIAAVSLIYSRTEIGRLPVTYQSSERQTLREREMIYCRTGLCACHSDSISGQRSHAVVHSTGHLLILCRSSLRHWLPIDSWIQQDSVSLSLILSLVPLSIIYVIRLVCICVRFQSYSSSFSLSVRLQWLNPALNDPQGSSASSSSSSSSFILQLSLVFNQFNLFLPTQISIAYLQHITSAEVLRRTNQKQLSLRLRNIRLQLFGHIARSDVRLDHTKALQSVISGFPSHWKRPFGRPRQTWRRTIQRNLSTLHIGLHTA